MIPEAREVHLSRKDRKVLEACCRSPVTLQRDLKRARIVLLAAAGRSTRSIAKEVGVQPRIVSLWRLRYADHGLEGLQDKPRPGKQPIYTKATDKRILKLLDKPPPDGFDPCRAHHQVFYLITFLELVESASTRSSTHEKSAPIIIA